MTLVDHDETIKRMTTALSRQAEAVKRIKQDIVRAGMLLQCGDDTAVLLGGVRLLRVVAPVLTDAGRYAGVGLKPEICRGVTVGRMRGQRERAAIEEEFSAISEE